MTDIQLHAGELWELGGERHVFDQEMGGGFLHFRSERTGAPFQVLLNTGERVSPTMEWFVGQFAEGCVRRLNLSARSSRAQREASLREDDFDAIFARDPRALVRQVVLTALDRMICYSRSDKSLRQAIAKIWSDKPRHLEGEKQPSPSTVRRWLDQRGQTGSRALKVMVNMSGRVTREKRLPDSVRSRMHEEAVAYWADHSRNIKVSYDALVGYLAQINRYLSERKWEPVPVPSKETFRKHVRSLECYETIAAKWGKAEAKKRYKPIGKGLVAHRPLLLGAMDHTLLDLHLVLELDQLRYLGRPWLTILIDVHSRCIVGWVLTFDPASLSSVTECIKRANRPKLQMLDYYPDCRHLAGIYGKFDEIVVDNGLEFVGVSFESAMTDAGISVRWVPSASPTYKAVVERFFGTLNELLNKRLPGGSFPVAQMKAWGLNPQKNAVLTLEQAEVLLERAIGLYHQEHHSFLSEAPAAAWARGVRAQGGVQVIGDDSQLDKMVGVEVERRLSRSGISLHGLDYHHPAVTGPLLEDLASSEPVRRRREGSATATVKVKYNPANIGAVHVWNARRGVFQTLPCTDPKYAEGLTRWQHVRVQEWLKEDQKLTDAQRSELRYDWGESIRGIASTKSQQRLHRTQARLLLSPKIQECARGKLRVEYADPRHDGLGPVIPQTPLAPERTDDHKRPTRPKRGGSGRPRSSSLTQGVTAPAIEKWSIDDGDWGVSQ